MIAGPTEWVTVQLAPAAAVDALLQLPAGSAQRQFLLTHCASFDATAVALLKAEADRQVRTSACGGLSIGALLRELGALQAAPSVTALGMVVEANSYSAGGQGEYLRASGRYADAVTLYLAQGQWVEAGRALVGQLFALAALGDYDQALAVGEQATHLFTQHGAAAEMAGLQWNLAILYGQQGNDRAALAAFDQVRAYYQQQGVAGTSQLPRVEQNRAVVLRNLGDFAGAIAASQAAHQAFLAQGEPIEAARTQQNLATTYLILGRYNEALAHLEEAEAIFVQHGRHADAMVVELQETSCLLHLRQFALVLNKCHHLVDHFTHTGQQPELGQTLLNAGLAYAGLQQLPLALQQLDAAQAIFTPTHNLIWHTMAELERATVQFHGAQQAAAGAERRPAFAVSQAISTRCCQIFAEAGLIVHEARAALLSARIAHASGDESLTNARLTQALTIGAQHDLPTLVYQVHALAGALWRQRTDLTAASDAYAQAIAALERLCNQTLVDFRPTFLEDKDALYEEMVDLCLALHEVDRGFAYAERAKSRALLAALAQPTPGPDQGGEGAIQTLAAQLAALRAEWNQLHRQLTLPETPAQPTRALHLWTDAAIQSTRHGALQLAQQRQLVALETQITDLWRQLQLQRASRRTTQIHAGDATATLRKHQPWPGAQTIVEYFTLRGRFIAFVVTPQGVRAVRLTATETQVAQLMRLLTLNWGAVLSADERMTTALLHNAQGLLQQLYMALWSPVAEALGTPAAVCIVPHGLLHHLPFHALYDGTHYLLERYELSYLPSAELLPYCQPPTAESPPQQTNALVIGHSYGGRLPHTIREARAVAAQVGGRLVVEEAATQQALQHQLEQYRLIHLATHGLFRADNHLFSGVALEDGWLTTLDVANLRLRASLVTLSACQSGRHIIGGGDELLGLLRAFLAAGACSLVATLWSVADESTAQLMINFYRHLATGLGKGAALRQAQLDLLYGTDNPARYRHPYYWAPFFLVGHSGPV